MTPNASLVGRRELGAGLTIFRFLPDVPATFEAGQHTTLVLSTPDGTALARPFSVASPPSERAVELLVRRQTRRDDDFVEVLFSLADGGQVVLGPEYAGEVTLERALPPGDRRLRLLVAAGTGVAPFLSMVRARKDDERTIVLHGARDPGELAAHGTLEEILGGRYLRTLSGADAAWRGLRGRVETLFDPGRIGVVEEAAGLEPGELTPSRAVVFVCGFPATIAGTVERLGPRGFAPGSVFFDPA